MKFSDIPVKPKDEKQELLKGIEVSLPSKGRDYSEGKDSVLICPSTMNEAKFISEMSPETYQENLTRLLQCLIVRPRALNPWSLTIGDRSYLFLWVRIQMSPTYQLPVMQCARCQEVFPNYSYDLTKVPIIPIGDDYTGPTEVSLPKSSDRVVLRLDTGEDEQAIQQYVKQDPAASEWVCTYIQPIVSVNDKKMSLQEKYAWQKKLDPADFGFLRQFHAWSFHGPDYANSPFECPKCKVVSLVDIPFLPEFYLPSLQFRDAMRDAIHSFALQKRSTGNDAGVEPDGVPGVHVPPHQDQRTTEG